jgi:hypothetical protein
MKKLLASALLLIIFLMLSACFVTGFFTPSTPVPTYTPNPTYTPQPTYTRAITPKPTRTVSPQYNAISWNELSDFLAKDHTNWHAYNADTYTCVNYAMDLTSHAHSEKIHAWIVGVVFNHTEPGHAFVAFETTDKGVVWIEPQSDYAYSSVVLGKPLCLAVETTACGDYGIVTNIVQPMECDATTSDCWKAY